MTETNTMDVIFVDYVLPGKPEGTTPQRVTLKEFLALPPEQLTEQNQKIQKALGQLYQLNDREPPLFHSFPKRKAGPLVINCTPNTKKNVGACYVPNANRVDIVEGTLKNTESVLLHVFAHELKHAEQQSEELCKMEYDARHNNGLAYHQLEYLIEAQAFAFGNYVSHLAQLNYSLYLDEEFKVFLQYKGVSPILEKHTKGKSIDAFPDIECEMMGKILPHLYNVNIYRDIFDELKPISDKDKGLTEGEIPDSFHFKDPREALSLLKDMPREARTPAEKIRHSIAMAYGEKTVVEEVFVKEKSISSDEVLDIIKTEFTRSPKDVTPGHIRRSKNMLNYFADLQVDGKPLMQEKDILDLLEGARASGRKDVEDAILAYKTDHPDDERFAKINFSESEGVKMTALQDEFYAKHPYLAKDKLFANLPDRVINEMNAFEVEMDNYIADYTKNNSTKPDYEPITNQLRYLWFMGELTSSIGDYVRGIKHTPRAIKDLILGGSLGGLDSSLSGLKRPAINYYPYLEGYDNWTIARLEDKKNSYGLAQSFLQPNSILPKDEMSDKEKEILAAYNIKVKQFRDYLDYLEKNQRGQIDNGWLFLFAPGYKNSDKLHRFQLVVKPSVKVLKDLEEFANKYNCQWKCQRDYMDWVRIDPVDIYTSHPDIEGQKRDLAAIVAKYGYDKAHCDVIDRFFDSERIADGAYMSKEWTKKDVEDLIAKAESLDANLAEYGRKQPRGSDKLHPWSAGMYEAYRTSINTYEEFLKSIGGPEKAKEPVIPTKGATLAPSKSAAPAPTPSKSTSTPTPARSKPAPTTIKTATRIPVTSSGEISGSKSLSKTSVKVAESPFEKMSDATLVKALAAAKDGTYWKFGLTVEQKSREAKKAGEDVPYFVYSAGGEHHEVVSTFTKDLDKEVCGKANKVLFSGLPEGENTSEGNPHAEAPLSKHLEIQIDITEGTGTSAGDKAAYQKAQSLLLAAYDSGVRRFTLTEMTPEEIKIWGDVRAALAGQGKSLEFVFDNADSQKTFDSHKADFAKIEDLNKTIHDVAEYKKRKAKEAEATKIKAVAGKKPVPALAAAKTAKGR